MLWPKVFILSSNWYAYAQTVVCKEQYSKCYHAIVTDCCDGDMNVTYYVCKTDQATHFIVASCNVM